MALYRRVLTSSRDIRGYQKSYISALPPPLTPESTPSGPTSKNFPPAARRGCLRHCPCGAPAACRQPPKACAAVQHTQCFGPVRWAHIFLSLRRRAGLGKEKRFFQLSKNTRRLLLAEHCWCWFSRSRELATGRPLALALVGNSRRSARREAAAEHKEHGVEHGVISGGEQARTHELPSSRDRHLQLEPKIFGLRR